MERYTKKHKTIVARDLHVKKIIARGGNVSVKGLTIIYFFPETKKKYPARKIYNKKEVIAILISEVDPSIKDEIRKMIESEDNDGFDKAAKQYGFVKIGRHYV